MTKLATYNRRGRRAAERKAWLDKVERQGIVTRTRLEPGAQLWMRYVDGALMDQDGREWKPPSEMLRDAIRRASVSGGLSGGPD